MLRRILVSLPADEDPPSSTPRMSMDTPRGNSSGRDDSASPVQRVPSSVDGLKVGALPFVSTLLGDDKDKYRRGRALQKSPEVALAALELLWASICVSARSHPDTCASLLDAFSDALEKTNAKGHRRQFAVRCVELIGEAATGWREHGGLWNGSPQAQLVYRLFPAILDSWGEKEPYVSSVYREMTRSEVIGELQEEMDVIGVLYSELLAYIHGMMSVADCFAASDWSAGIKARLHVLGYLYRGSRYAMGVQDMEGVWALATAPFEVREIFFSWLRMSFVRHDKHSCFDQAVSSWCLSRLSGLAEASAHTPGTLGCQGFHCLQVMFVEVNNAQQKVRADITEADVGNDMVFFSAPPPPSLSGRRMIGRRIKVLQKTKKLKDAEITSYEWGKYTLTYSSGNTEKWDLAGLREWHLLPEPSTMEAGPVDVHEVHQSDLLGLSGVWAAALHDTEESVSVAAGRLLLALYAAMHEVDVVPPPPGGSLPARGTRHHARARAFVRRSHTSAALCSGRLRGCTVLPQHLLGVDPRPGGGDRGRGAQGTSEASGCVQRARRAC